MAVTCAATAWLRPLPELDADDAVEVARSAFAAGDVEARIDPAPGSGTYTTSAGEDVEVWKVLADLDGGRVAIWIARDDGQLVFLDDRAPGGAGQVLSDSTVAAIGSHRDNPVRDRHLRDNLAVTAAAVALVIVAVQVAAHLGAPVSPRAGRTRANVLEGA
ncbi:MAG: hypothetical protein ACLGI8_15760 [Acidimicrobiia bacterium]